MFQLTDASLERIIFAMEDQSKTLLINLETGDLVEADTLSPEERNDPHGKYVAPPMWDSRHGFSVLEAFSAMVTAPPELKASLSAALRRGKGVFKAFRRALSADEALFQRFQEFKLRAMRPIVEEWMNAQREGQSLEVLKDEPEDIADLIASDIDIHIVPEQDATFNLDSFISLCEMSLEESVPSSIRTWFLKNLMNIRRMSDSPLFLGFATADGTNPLMVGLFSIQTPIDALPFCMVHGIVGKQDSNGLGIEWQILDTIGTYSLQLGASLLVLEGPLFPAAIAQEAKEHGFNSAGSILYRAL